MNKKYAQYYSVRNKSKTLEKQKCLRNAVKIESRERKSGIILWFSMRMTSHVLEEIMEQVRKMKSRIVLWFHMRDWQVLPSWRSWNMSISSDSRVKHKAICWMQGGEGKLYPCCGNSTTHLQVEFLPVYSSWNLINITIKFCPLFSYTKEENMSLKSDCLFPQTNNWYMTWWVILDS